MAVLKRFTSRLGGALADRVLTHRALVYNPYLSGKYFPVQGGQQHVVVDNVTASENGSIPPMQLWEGYGATSQEYLASGRDDVGTMLELLASAAVSPRSLLRVLDLGCGAGRMLRCFPHEEPQAELWGVDVKSE